MIRLNAVDMGQLDAKYVGMKYWCLIGQGMLTSCENNNMLIILSNLLKRVQAECPSIWEILDQYDGWEDCKDGDLMRRRKL